MSTKPTTMEESSDQKDPAPLYITIGPQCCGKTTLLKDIEGLQDVCLDDQMDVYMPIATQQWMEFLKSSTNEEGEVPVPEELQHQIQGKTIAQRIQNDSTELNLILQRWNGDLTPSDFADSISQHYANNTHSNNRNQRNDTPNVAKILVQVVEDFLSGSPELPAKTDVFCLESLFKPHAKTNQSAIQVAHHLLKTAPLHIPLAWGNTNSKAKDFQEALDIACSTKRPVHFLLCHPTWKLEEDGRNIPWVDLPTLLTRNLQRLQASGRYIPANAIADCCHRIEHQLIPSDCKSPWDVEQALVFQTTQPVRRHEKPLPYRYVLTRERLIQKSFQERRGPPQQQHQDQRRQYSGPPQGGRHRNYDNSRRFDADDRSRRRNNDDRRGGRGRGGRGQWEDRRGGRGRGGRGEWSQDRQSQGGYSDWRDRDYSRSHGDNKRYKR